MPDPIPQIELRDPATLRPHPATQHLHLLAEDDPRFLNLVDAIARGGFDADKPIAIDPQGRIFDGRHRWRAAKRLQLTAVPCVVREEEEGATLILNSIIARKHYTKGALAFETYPLFQAAHQEAHLRKLTNLRKGQQIPEAYSVGFGKTLEDFAQSLGISPALFDQAAAVHKLFGKDPEYATLMLPRIYGEPQGGEHESKRPVGLGAVLAGHSGREKTLDKDRPASSQLELFTAAWDTVAKRVEYWNDLPEAQRRAALEKIKQHTARMPVDLLEQWASIIRNTLKEKSKE